MLPPNVNAQPLGSQAEQQVVDYSKEYVESLKQRITKLEAQRDERAPYIMVFVAFLLGLASCDGAVYDAHVVRSFISWIAARAAHEESPYRGD
jgi:predicted glycosyl hydrolase (DUF1957 family)